MKTAFTLVLALLSLSAFSQIGIGTTTPHESSILDISSTNKGFLLPRMTEAEKQLIQDPAIGLWIYNKDAKCLQIFNPDGWYDMCCHSIKLNESLPFLYRIEPSLNNFQHGKYITEIEDVSNGKFFLFSQGLEEQSDSTFIYNSDGSISRTRSISTGHYGINSLKYVPEQPYQGELEFYMNAKFDDNLKDEWASFFGTSNDPHIESSLQICAGVDYKYNTFGINCSKDFYSIAYRNNGATDLLCGKTDAERVYNTTNDFEVFGIKSYKNDYDQFYTLEFLINGSVIDYNNKMTNYVKIDAFKLFSNRFGGKGVKSSIKQLYVFDKLLSEEDRGLLNRYLLCKNNN